MDVQDRLPSPQAKYLPPPPGADGIRCGTKRRTIGRSRSRWPKLRSGGDRRGRSPSTIEPLMAKPLLPIHRSGGSFLSRSSWSQCFGSVFHPVAALDDVDASNSAGGSSARASSATAEKIGRRSSFAFMARRCSWVPGLAVDALHRIDRRSLCSVQPASRSPTRKTEYAAPRVSQFQSVSRRKGKRAGTQASRVLSVARPGPAHDEGKRRPQRV